MRRRLAAAIVATLAVSLAIGASPRVAAAADSLIDVVGNRHIGADAIRSYFSVPPGGRLDAAALDATLKRMYETGLFQDVKISHDGDRILVTVAENPTIEKIAFEGNKKVKDDDLKKGLQSKGGGPLSRPFVQGDVEHMIALYRQRGYFEVHIEPQTIAIKSARGSGKKDADNNGGTNAKNKRAHDEAKDAGERVDLVFTINEGDKLAVRTILFAGNKAFPSNKLQGVVKIGRTNVLSFLLDNDTYDADRIENDRDLLRQFYLAHGYAEVRVLASANYDAGKKGVVLTFTLNEGPQYRFGKVDIASSLKAIDAATLRPYLTTQSGNTYDADAVNKTVDALTMQLAKDGSPFAAVSARSERVADQHLMNVIYDVAEGERLYVERIEIHGNTKTQDNVIRREFDIAEGDAYNRALVARSERRLKQLGYFKSVKISTQPGSAPDRVVLDVAIEEQGTGNFSISGGYSTSAGWLGEVSVSEMNFMGTGDIAKASVTFGQYAEGFDLSFTDPYFLGQRLSAGVDLFAKESLANSYQSYDTLVYGGKVSFGTPLTDQLTVTTNYSLYNQGISLDPSSGTASLPIQQAAATGPIWVSSIGNTDTYSTLDNNKDPTSGIRLQTNNEVAGLGGAAQFARTTEDVRYYHPIAGDVVGMVRAQGGYVAPWGGQQLPLLDGFFGGPQLVRGFAPNGFGPRDITPGTTMDNIGGNAYWTTSAELQAPVPGIPADANLKAALFSDVGSLWATSASSASSLASLSPAQQIANSRAPRASIGAALIWDSPFGAMQVDYAYPILKQPNDVTQRLQFSAGAF